MFTGCATLTCATNLCYRPHLTKCYIDSEAQLCTRSMLCCSALDHISFVVDRDHAS